MIRPTRSVSTAARLVRALALLLTAAFAAPAPAQLVLPFHRPGSPDAGEGLVAVGHALRGALVRLHDNAGFEEGCFPPCLCPVFFREDLRGTLRLAPLPAAQPGVNRWRVFEANWFITWGQDIRRVVGHGEYTQAILPGGPPTHRLTMQLSIDDEPAERYDSGHQAFVPTPGVLPLFDLSISRNGMYCYDRVFRVATERIPGAAVASYSVRGTNYIEGCFPPCLCPVWFTADVTGRFDLVELGQARNVPAYALVEAYWGNTLSTTPSFPLRASGYGVYRIGSPGILPVIQHEMIMDMTINGAPGRLESGLLPASSLLPTIDIDIAENGFFCYDRVFEILANPIP